MDAQTVIERSQAAGHTPLAQWERYSAAFSHDDDCVLVLWCQTCDDPLAVEINYVKYLLAADTPCPVRGAVVS